MNGEKQTARRAWWGGWATGYTTGIVGMVLGILSVRWGWWPW